jgi:hypothetical protein
VRTASILIADAGIMRHRFAGRLSGASGEVLGW